MKYIDILYTGYCIKKKIPHLHSPTPPPPPPPTAFIRLTQIHLSFTVIVIYCTRACFHYHVIFSWNYLYTVLINVHTFHVVLILYYPIYIFVL